MTVNVCGWPTSFVPDVPIVIRASKSTYCFCALALSPGSPSPVVRVRTTPPTVTSVVAWIVFAPGALEVILTVHSPFGSTVVQLLGPTKVAEPVGIEKVISVPGGAVRPPVPALTLTCPVSVCVSLTWLTAVGGVIWISAVTTASGSQAPTEPL